MQLSLKMHAPDFTLVDVKNRTISLSDFKGEYVLLVFNRGFL
ncbi:redoxin domain-containing protein [Pseudodesulfovibrio sp. JC047]|nr:redoxin domain-containing protein [Pseudodesulfovibrio sp. JC047]